jgi:glyoxylase-like metal-dependent hydrolase (beta-lactamase superfamily II)
MSFVSTRQVGGALVSLIREGTGRWNPNLLTRDGEPVPADEWRRLAPGVDDSGRADVAFSSVLVRVGGVVALVDCCFGEPEPGEPWGQLELRRTPGVEAGLALVGVSPTQVTHVLMSHDHGDHLAGATVIRNGARAARYPNARYVISRAEWTARGDDPLGLATLHLEALESEGKLDLVDGDFEVTPGLTFLHAPGESLGHSVVRVHSEGEVFYDLADLFHFECEVEHQDWSPWGVDIATAMKTRRRIVADALTNDALCVLPHGLAPGFGRFAGTVDRPSWRWAPD